MLSLLIKKNCYVNVVTVSLCTTRNEKKLDITNFGLVKLAIKGLLK